MTAALSPGLSWLILGGWLLAVVLIVAFFMGANRASREYDEGVDFLNPQRAPVDRYRVELDASLTLTSAEPRDPKLRIFGGVYDHQDRGDFR